MKRNLFAIFILCFALVLCLCAVTAFAWSEPQVVRSDELYHEYAARCFYPGVIKGVDPSAKTARDVLRYSAGLGSSYLTKDPYYNNVAAADLDFDGKITSKDARKLLRVSAKLEKIDPLPIRATAGVPFQVDTLPFYTAYKWSISGPDAEKFKSSEKLIVRKTYDDKNGASSPTVFELTANAPGRYELTAVQKALYSDDTHTIDFVIDVTAK